MNLEAHIKAWRQKLYRQGNFEEGHLEELESHLRDRIDALCEEGYNESDAFEKARQELGNLNTLGEENFKAHTYGWSAFFRAYMPSIIVNYLKIASRQLTRNKLYAFINIFGMALGLTCSLFITYYVIHELSYDHQYEHRPIYRINNQERLETGAVDVDAGGPVPLGTVLEEEFSEVKEAIRFWRAYRPALKVDHKVFEEKKLVFADKSAIQVFGFDLVQGNPATALAKPNQVLLSESMAMKYFGTQDVMGRTMEYTGYPGNDLEFQVSGVFKDLPSNTHFSFDFLASFETLKDWRTNWGSFKPVWTYVVLNSKNDAKHFEANLQKLRPKYFPDRLDQEADFKFKLEHISDIHLHSAAGRPMKPGGSIALIQIITIIAVLILVMSSVNFINISLARAMTRLKEMGIRKVLGATKGHIIQQFLTETFLSLFLALILAVGLTFLLKDQFAQIASFDLNIRQLITPAYLLMMAGVMLFIFLLSGLYPAIVLSGMGTINSLAGKIFNTNGDRHLSLRYGLIFFQSMISSMLIIGVLGINDQLQYIMDKPTGISMDNRVVIPYSEKPETMENQLNAIPGVLAYTYSQQLPVNTLNYDGRPVNRLGSKDWIQVQSSFVSPNFIDTYDIKLLEGRSFLKDTRSDSNQFIINETLAQLLGWNRSTAVGKRLRWSGQMKGRIVGVVRDFHLGSVHEPIPPMIMLPAYEHTHWQTEFITIQIDEKDKASTLREIETAWRDLNPERPYRQFFIKDSYRNLHTSDFLFAKLILIFTIITIIISSSGLFALSAYTAERRRKEIGIRKVLGSKLIQVFYKISLPFISITLISSVIAIPLVIWGLDQWLDTFAYHTVVQPGTVITGALIIFFISILSILRETLRAAYINPVELLRDE